MRKLMIMGLMVLGMIGCGFEDNHHDTPKFPDQYYCGSLKNCLDVIQVDDSILDEYFNELFKETTDKMDRFCDKNFMYDYWSVGQKASLHAELITDCDGYIISKKIILGNI